MEEKMEAQILLWIQNNLRNPILDPIMQFITSLGDGGILWIVVTIVLLIIPKTRKTGLLCLISLGFTVLVNNIILKNLVNRTRPYVAIPDLILITKEPGDASFPSGHTAASFSVAVVMLMTMKKRYGIPAIILATLIALSRLYVGVHYPTDVLGGFVVSTLIAVATVEISKPVSKSIEKKLALKKAKKNAQNLTGDKQVASESSSKTEDLSQTESSLDEQENLATESFNSSEKIENVDLNKSVDVENAKL